MAKVSRKVGGRKKQPKLPRKIRTGIALAPTNSFRWFTEHFRLEVDKKDIAGVLRNWIRSEFDGEDRKFLLSGPEHVYTNAYGAAASIHWKNLGQEFPSNWNHDRRMQLYIEEVRYWTNKKIQTQKDSDTTTVKQRSPMDIVKEKTSDFIAEIEEVLDLYNTDVHVDWEEYSVYNEMVKSDLNSFSAKHVYNYYKPLKDELEELVNKKTPDLVEGYSHWNVKQRKEFLAIITRIVDDANKYVLSKKAVRKPSKPRVKTADKQIAKLVYLKESKEFKLTSIDPIAVIGAKRLYTFNTKTRMLTEYVSRSSKGFEVKGTTLQLFDKDVSRGIRLRKPEETLTDFMSRSPAAINRVWKTLTTKTVTDVNGRINKDTILLRALDK